MDLKTIVGLIGVGIFVLLVVGMYIICDYSDRYLEYQAFFNKIKSKINKWKNKRRK